MSNEKISKILTLHSVPHYIQNENIFADTMEANTEEFEKVENLTGYNKNQLYDWLGY